MTCEIEGCERNDYETIPYKVRTTDPQMSWGEEVTLCRQCSHAFYRGNRATFSDPL